MCFWAGEAAIVADICSLRLCAHTQTHKRLEGRQLGSGAKCNNHCELQNSVNRLTSERRSDLGAFLRACLCQCFLHIQCVVLVEEQ